MTKYIFSCYRDGIHLEEEILGQGTESDVERVFVYWLDFMKSGCDITTASWRIAQ